MYIIGDIHGCFKTLKKLYKKIKKKEEVYSVGDMVDKGPDTALVLDFIINKKIKPIKGNHEIFFEIYIEKYLNNIDISNSRWYKEYGGDRTINSYLVYPTNIQKTKMKQHLEFIKSLPYYYLIDKLLITHGFGLPYSEKLGKIDESLIKQLTCNRLYGKYFNIKKDYEKLNKNLFNVFGHDVFKKVFKDNLFFGIDTGCCYGKTKSSGGKLTVLEYPTLKTISIKVIDNVDYKGIK